MALATQCPHCQTTFRVVHDQLKLRAGLVRCGHCKEIFNGIEHLLPPPDMEPAEKVENAVAPVAVETSPATTFTDAPESSAEQSATSTLASAELDPPSVSPVTESEDQTEASRHTPSDRIDFDIPEAFEPEVEHEPARSAEPSTEPLEIKREDPLQRMTLVDFTREYPEESDSAEQENTDTKKLGSAEDNPTFDQQSTDELDEAIEDLQRKPWRSKKKSAKGKNRSIQEEPESFDDDEPAFVKRGRRNQRLGKKLRIALSIACLILLIAAFLQATYLFRNQIAGMFPQAKPFLTQLCDALACRIELPAQISAVSIESSELQTLAENKESFVLTTLLRNYSDTLQAWPHIELTLNDANEKPLLRRVFKPIDYLSESEIRKGFSPSSEHSVKLSFELTQIKASGYRVYLFYP